MLLLALLFVPRLLLLLWLSLLLMILRSCLLLLCRSCLLLLCRSCLLLLCRSCLLFLSPGLSLLLLCSRLRLRLVLCRLSAILMVFFLRERRNSRSEKQEHCCRADDSKCFHDCCLRY